MSLPKLHFVHGNSFPTATYRLMLDQLRPHYEIDALPMHAHDPRYPVTDGWRHLRQELVDALRAKYREPVILLGHSMGGMLSMMTARAHPELVRCVVMLDAPVVSGWRAQLLRLAKWRGIMHKVSPAGVARARRHVWASRDDAYAHYAAKPMFAAWAPQVLHDYVDGGLLPHKDGGVTLRFEREIEAEVYSTLPHDFGRMIRPPFPVPIGFVGGTDSEECRMAGLAATRKLVGKHFRQIPGGHLFTMEHPEAVAEAAHAMITELTASRD